MDCKLVPLNNTTVISMNSRKPYKVLKKIRVKSFDKLPEVPVITNSLSLQKTEQKSKFYSQNLSTSSLFSQVLPKNIKESLFEVDVNLLETEDLKTLLKKIVNQELQSLKQLNDRCHILSKMVKVFEISSSFSEKDAHDLMSLLDQMAKTVINTSETEIELGIKTRLAEKKNLEASAFRKNYEILHKRSFQSEQELKELREKIKNLQEENIKQLKITENERHRFSESKSKIQTLENSLWVLANSNNNSPQDSILKLKGAIHALLRDAYDYKKEIQHL